jgi:hypothetical protein
MQGNSDKPDDDTQQSGALDPTGKRKGYRSSPANQSPIEPVAQDDVLSLLDGVPVAEGDDLSALAPPKF